MAGRRLLGHGMYAPLSGDRAEVAFTVAHDAQGHGVGTLLLRRLAAIAFADGIATFVADVLPDNHRMIDMFRESGFDPSLRSGAGTIEVESPTAPTPEALERYLQRERSAAVAGCRHLLQPDGVVIVGASRRRGTVAGELVHNVLAAGYTDRCISSTTTRTRCRADLRIDRWTTCLARSSWPSLPSRRRRLSVSRARARPRCARARGARGGLRQGRPRRRGAPGRAPAASADRPACGSSGRTAWASATTIRRSRSTRRSRRGRPVAAGSGS